MKKKVFSLMMTLLLAFMGVARADELTVNDGTATNAYVPVYGFYADAYNKCEFVQPAADLADMNGATINGMTFYASQSSVSWGTAEFEVFLAEVPSTTLNNFVGDGTIVYQGAMSIVNGEMNVTFSTPYTYNGGNLLVGIYQLVTGSYVTSSWYGVTANGASVQGYNYNSLSSISPTQRNFLPKVTFDYAAGGAGAGDQLFAVQDGDVVDTVFVGPRPNNAWMEPFTFQIRNTGAATTITNLDWTPNTYFTLVEPELPVAIARDEDIDVSLATLDAQGNTDWQMVAIYGTGRTAAIWNINVEPYEADVPDVWEMACEEATSFPFVEVPATAHNVTLYDNYTLPFPEIPEGYDAVYKLVFDNDMMLNAEVTSGADGKVALYTEDFYGEGGPMATNNYNGPQVGGGATGGSFEAMIGDETTTTTSTYFPFHTLWNYSLAENLFLASELNEASVTTAPMTSLSWYVSSMSCTTPQNNISIWMANVDDAALTSTSHTTAGMTLVYTGSNVLPTAGQWNEFVFNQGNFAWDGHSNILILCTRNNGTYQGSISWQTHNPGFVGMCYHYSDTNGGYNVATTPYSGMYTSSTNRANIIFKGGGREGGNRDVVLEESFENGIGNWTMSNCHSNTGVTSSYPNHAHSGSNTFRFYYTTNPPQYLISPMLNGTENGVDVSFYYTGYSTSYTETFHVGYSTTTNDVDAFTFGPEFTMEENGEWSEYTNSFPAGTKYVAVKCTSDDQFYLFLDDFTFTATAGGGNTPILPDGVSYGPVITDAPVEAGTYYLVASSTDHDFEVTINAEDMPCPEVDGFAFNPTPADDEDGVEPGSVTLRWNIPANATGWRLIFGSTYYPDPNHPQTIMYPEDGSFSTTLANSYTVRNLWNNTNYFWRVEFNNSGACPQGVSGPVWGFTTHLNIPQNLTAVDYTVFDDEQIVLNWNAIQDRTYRKYGIYRDGVKIDEISLNNVSNTTYTDGPLAYNMAGYVYNVTAIYDEGESAPSDPVTVKVSGYGDVNGHVYEQNGTTGIANAIVTMVGTDEFGDPHTYNFTTDGNGYYTGHIYAGVYNGSAACNGYQTITEPVQGNPININYNQTTTPVDYMLDENFDPVCAVIAEYYPDSLDPNSPYVKVYWGCGLPGSDIIEPFETGDFSMFDWQVDPTYPWTITTNNPYEGTYCMKSGGAGVANVVSNMTVTVDIPADGEMSFFGKISCENNWDYGYFYIDGTQMGSYTGAGNWGERTFNITQGTHTFQWRYTKDSSVNSNDDCFYVDYISFYKQPAAPIPGMTYDFDNSTMQGWTSLDADGDGYGWMLGSDVMGTGYGHNGSSDCVLSMSYNNSVGVLYPDNYLVSPQVELGGILHFYACAQDASYAAEHFGVAVSTTVNNQASAFTTIQEWTMSAKEAPAKKIQLGTANGEKGMGYSRDGNVRAQGNWYEYTVDLSAYSGMGYVAIRHFNCSDMFYLDVDDITIGEPGKGVAETRALDHYNVYRTNCYNDGPYEEPTTVFLATVWVPDTVYIDVEWADLPAGVYKWGVGAVYSGNRGEEIESEITWSEPVNVNNDKATRATVPVTFNMTDSYGDGWNGGYIDVAENGTSVAQVTLSTGSSGSQVVELNEGSHATLTWNAGSWDGEVGCDVVMNNASIFSFSSPTAGLLFEFDVTASGGSGSGQGGNTYGPGGEPIQEERESVIVWSNCLDKDMYLNGVTVTVLLNSADSPEGTTVDFTNLNEYEQQTYGGYNLTLEDNGYYAFESFRRGDYAIKVALDGYETVYDTVSIWENMDLRYVLIEILYGVENVYVSRTGWAMWDDSHNIGGGGNGGNGGGNGATSFTEDFENGFANWTLIDADGDGLNWYHSSQSMTYACYDYTGWGHNESDGFAVSSSYTDCTYDSFDPNNFLVTNQKYSIVNGSTLNFWADYGNDSYPDHFGVAVATVDNPTASDFTIVWEGNAKNGNAGKSQVRHNGDRYFNWRSHSVDLSAYAGQDVYIAFRHFNSYDEYEIYIDDVTLTAGAKNADEMQHFEYYKVMCTSIDGVPIYNHNTVWPFCQLSTNEPYNAPLVEGEHYLCKVATVYSTGISAWSEPVEWEYEPCDHWGPVDEVTANTTNNGNLIEWVFDHGFNPYDPGTGGGQAAFDWYYYDNGVNEDAIGTGGGNFWWAVMFPAGSYEGHQVTKVAAYDYMAMTGTASIYQGGSNAPAGSALGQTNVTFTGSEDFVEFNFASAVTIDPTQNLWVVFYNGSGATYPAAVCANTGDANGRWVSLDGSTWEDLAGYDLDYTFMLRAYVGDGAKGGWVGSKGGSFFTQYAEDGVMLDFLALDNVDFRVYMLYTLSNDSRFSLVPEDENGQFILTALTNNGDFMDEFEMVYSNAVANFSQMSKVDIAEHMTGWKSGVSPTNLTSVTIDVLMSNNRPENDHCINSLPFCTSEMITFQAANTSNTANEPGMDQGCIYNSYNPSFYHMRIHTAGQFVIHMEGHDPDNGTNRDIDFCIWGPYTEQEVTSGAACQNLSTGKIIDCCYSPQYDEDCYLGYPEGQHNHHGSSTSHGTVNYHVPEVGEYYILMITNYSQQPCVINFTKSEGEGETDCNIVTNTDILGFLITEDGEYLAFAGPDDREYLHEGEYGDHEYCVRPIYPGDMILPSNNFGWSMGCPVCAETNGGGQIACEPGDPIHSELVDANHIKVWWGDEPQAPMEEWLYYFDENATQIAPIGTGGSDVYWGIMFPAASIAPYAGTSLTEISMYQIADYNNANVTVNIFLGGSNAPQTLVSTMNYTPSVFDDFEEVTLTTPVPIDGTQNLWITVKQYGTYPALGVATTGNANARWISLDGNSWEDVASYDLNYDWLIMGYVTNQAKGGDVTPIEFTPGVAPANFTLSQAEMVSANLNTMNRSRAEIVKYNVYRSTEANGEYVLIGEVTEETAPNYYEYIDSPTLAGTYYYQVTAVYDDGCESDPALAADGSGHDYVSQTTTAEGVDENGGMAIFPNPTKANVTIQAKGMQHITVVSVLGQMVYDADVDADEIILNMSQFAAGMYTVRVITENGMHVERVSVVR